MVRIFLVPYPLLISLPPYPSLPCTLYHTHTLPPPGLLSVDMPGFLKGINYISPLKYATENLTPYTLRGMTFTCEDFQRLPDGRCPLETGEQVLQLFHMDIDPAPRLGAVVATTVVYRIVAYLVLRLVRTDVGGLWRRRRE